MQHPKLVSWLHSALWKETSNVIVCESNEPRERQKESDQSVDTVARDVFFCTDRSSTLGLCYHLKVSVMDLFKILLLLLLLFMNSVLSPNAVFLCSVCALIVIKPLSSVCWLSDWYCMM